MILFSDSFRPRWQMVLADCPSGLIAFIVISKLEVSELYHKRNQLERLIKSVQYVMAMVDTWDINLFSEEMLTFYENN